MKNFFFDVILSPFFNILRGAIKFYEIILIVRIVMSWLNPDPYNRLVILIRSITDPFLDFFRKLLPFLHVGMIDLSPLVAFLTLEIVQKIIWWLSKTIFQ